MKKVLELAALGKVFEVMDDRLRDVFERVATGRLPATDLDRAIRDVMLDGGDAAAKVAVEELGQRKRMRAVHPEDAAAAFVNARPLPLARQIPSRQAERNFHPVNGVVGRVG
ncbi:MAG: hypothetical protein FJX72_16295, partial [Armatimonadetes bacterium]|nr:hypothetical protein [Armatimonadota bacterium]